MSRPKVFLTRRWPEPVELALRQHFDVSLNVSDDAYSQDELKQAFEEFDAVCPCVADMINAELFSDEKTRAKIIANYGVGYNNIDFNVAKSLGIAVTNTPDVLSEATAELAITLLLMLARRSGEGERHVRNGDWSGWYPTHMMGTQVTGKTLGIVGMGRIGLTTAIKAQQGFDMKVIYHNRNPVKLDHTSLEAEFFEDMEPLLAQADFVSLHCPSTPQTRHMINKDTLELFKTGAFLINTSRGDVVDEVALADALTTGKLAGAGLDVYEKEPVITPRLIDMENVVLLPHLGSATLETRIAMGMRVLQNLLAYFDGAEPPDRVA